MSFVVHELYLNYNSILKKIQAKVIWEIDGETVETVADFIFLGSKITADGDCSHELKDAYSLEEKLWPTWTQNIKKQ